MNKKLAIKGDKERGNEVIALLEMLGGNNVHNLYGGENYAYYVIEGVDNEIRGVIYIFADENLRVFTLDEFYEKCPYKVGDKVTLDNKLCTVIWMCWECNNIYYSVQGTDVMFTKKVTADELKPYKEQDNMETTVETNISSPDITADVIDKNNCGIQCPDGYEFYDENGNLIGTKVMMRPKKPKYPKTYVECCEYIANSKPYAMNEHYTDVNKLLQTLQNLIICRNAYWKIAGEQLGLNKPWKPDWTNEKQISYGLYNELKYSIINPVQFVFPTEEMRDAFYDNFKDLIEQCKELL